MFVWRLHAREQFGRRTVRTLANRGTRVTRNLITFPQRVDEYFEQSFIRKLLWCGIASGSGYYSANMVSLSFGALAINDVVAAVITVAVCEIISRLFYEQWPSPPLWALFANCFKVGVEFAFIADAFKLAG
jgi:hypothetical protein